MLRGTTHIQEHLDHGGGLSYGQNAKNYGRNSAGVQVKTSDTMLRHLGFHHPDRENATFTLPKLTIPSRSSEAAQSASQTGQSATPAFQGSGVSTSFQARQTDSANAELPGKLR